MFCRPSFDKTKNSRPNTGRERLRVTRFHPICALDPKGLEDLQGPHGTSLEACNGASRSTYLYGRNAGRPYVLFHAHGWFSAVVSGNGSQSMAASPCRIPGRVLVPVNTFRIYRPYYMPLRERVKPAQRTVPAIHASCEVIGGA